jgi:hypothetical protein
LLAFTCLAPEISRTKGQITGRFPIFFLLSDEKTLGVLCVFCPTGLVWTVQYITNRQTETCFVLYTCRTEYSLSHSRCDVSSDTDSIGLESIIAHNVACHSSSPSLDCHFSKYCQLITENCGEGLFILILPLLELLV